MTMITFISTVITNKVKTRGKLASCFLQSLLLLFAVADCGISEITKRATKVFYFLVLQLPSLDVNFFFVVLISSMRAFD
jgi:hypothetical protein